jgi:cell division protein FtsN
VTGRRLSVRDYKGPRRDGLSFAWLRPFALGLVLGLAIAAAVFIESRRHLAAGNGAVDVVAQAPGSEGHTASSARAGGSGSGSDTESHSAASAPPAASASGTAAGAALPKYDFYQMLPRSQVLIPARESAAHLPASAPVDRPGTYFLQIGSYRDAAVADRVRAQAQKLGVTASVQRIVVDAATWHRVRVGPIHDLAVLNRVRHQLQAGNLEAMIVRVNP